MGYGIPKDRSNTNNKFYLFMLSVPILIFTFHLMTSLFFFTDDTPQSYINFAVKTTNLTRQKMLEDKCKALLSKRFTE